jgi:hypothetical protein
MDFLGNQPPGASEAAIFGNPTFRIRHFNFKIETPIVDVLFGQSWQLFGWQPYFHPATVEIQGVPGQVYSRAVQARISRRVHSKPVDLEIAAAAARPPQRDSATPDLHGGLRLTINDWKGLRTAGSTGTSIDALAIGVSAVYRRFELPEFSATPSGTRKTAGWGVSIDALLPIVRATTDDHANALTLTGSFVKGEGIADLFTGLNAGVSFPALPGGGTATYAPNIDGGLVSYDANGNLHAIAWQAFLVGLQYHLPVDGVWLAANYSQMSSSNATDFGGPKAFDKSRWADGNVFWDATTAVRFGAEYAYFEQTYGDGTKAKNHRGQLSAFYRF